MRRIVAASAFVGLSMFNTVHASGIPVIDAAAIAKFVQQIALAQQQIDQAKRQFESMTGTRNLGDILNNPALREALPADVRGLLDNLQWQSAVLQDSVNSILTTTRAPVNYALESKEIRARLEQINANISALTQQAYDVQAARLQQIDALQAQINATQDTKAIQDLQARIQIENANVQVERSKIDLAIRSLEAEKALVEDRANHVQGRPFSAETVKGALLPGVN